MTAMSQIVTSELAVTGPLRGVFWRAFTIGVVLVMMVIVVLGFRPFYAALATGSVRAHWLIVVHAAVFSGWMLLLLAQTILVFRRRIVWHQRLGRAGIWLGGLVLTLGLIVTFAAPMMSVRDGRSTLDEAAAFVILPLGDMLLFAGFFAAGIMNRRRKELHKPLMLLATLALLFAPAARLGFDGGPAVALAIWLTPLAAVIAHEAVTQRRVARVYLIGSAILLIAFSRIAVMDSEHWLSISRPLLMTLMKWTGMT
jgi:hypothetical protein